MLQSDLNAKYNMTRSFYTVELICVVLVAVKIIFYDHHVWKIWFLLMCVLAILLLSAWRCGDHSLFMAGVFAAGMKRIDFRKLLKIDLICKIIITLLIITLCNLGLFENYSTTVNGSVKYSLGFYHPNMLGAIVGAILIEYLYLRFYKFGLIDLFIYMGVMLWLVQITKARTMLLMQCIIFAVFIVLRRAVSFEISRKFPQLIIKLIVVFYTGITIFCIYSYERSNDIWYMFNQWFSGRIYLAQYYWDTYGACLFGQKIRTVSSRINDESITLILDSSYTKLIVMYGISVLVLLCIGYFFLFKNLLERKNLPLLAIAIYFCTIGLSENYFMRPAYNLTLLLLIFYTENVQTDENQALHSQELRPPLCRYIRGSL